MISLKVQNLKKIYKNREAVKDVSLEVASGNIVGLLGPNGAGKTTCFYMIVGLIASDGGTVHLNNTNITHMPMHKRAQLGLGYLPQEASVFRRLSVEKNILAVLETRKDLSHKECHEKMEILLDEFNIKHIRHIAGISLSGGERRRTEIARALAMDPSFILLDEPFAGVDPISVSDVKNIICHLKNRGIGVLITDHNVRETLDICEHAYIVSEGSVLAQGDSCTILANKKVRDVYLGHQFSL